MIYYEHINCGVLLQVLIQIFCSQIIFDKFNLICTTKEDVLSCFFSFNFILYKIKLKEKKQMFFKKNEFSLNVGDKISFLIGFWNSEKFLKKILFNKTNYPGIQWSSDKSIFLDPKVFLNFHKHVRNFQASFCVYFLFLLFIFKKFKNSVSILSFYLNYDKNHRVIPDNFYFLNWLYNLKNYEHQSKLQFENTNAKLHHIKRLSYYQTFQRSIFYIKTYVCFSLHRYLIFRISKKIMLSKFFYKNQSVYLFNLPSALKMIRNLKFLFKDLASIRAFLFELFEKDILVNLPVKTINKIYNACS